MTPETIIAVVTIICTMITTVVGLIVRSGVIGLTKTVGEQTVQLAGMHQTIIAQAAKIHNDETTKTAEMDAAVMKQQHSQPDQTYSQKSVYKPPNTRS
jgi:hypothetical protein